MADIEIGYKGSTITSINSGGVTTLNTIGTFCEDNITVTFNKIQGEAFTPATTITTNPSITLSATTGTITAFYSGASNITPTVTPGYVSAGTAGTVRTSGTSTYQLSTVAARTITPTTASQLAVASGRFTTGSVYVGAIPSTYVQPTGTLTISANGTYDVTEYASASISVAGGEYYEVYKAIALNSDLTSDVTGLEAFCNTLSSIPQMTFVGRQWSGNFTFSNLLNIPGGAFMFPDGTGYTLNMEFSFNLPQCSRIWSDAFYNNKNIRYINAPMCSIIYNNAFISCSIVGISAPLCSSIASSAFAYCRQLTFISFPSLRSLEGYVFSSCSNLSYAYIPSLSIIDNYAFNLCTKLEYIQTSNITSIGSYAFGGCPSLSSINLLSCTYMGMGALANCGLSIINAPELMFLNSSVFTQCKQLNTVILSNAQTIYQNAFASCYNFISLYLLGSSIVSLTNWNAFNSTPISTYTTSTGGVNGSIFVKASLYDSYLTARTWSLYSSRFASLTDAEIEALGF